jgi:hypothetical protein
MATNAKLRAKRQELKVPTEVVLSIGRSVSELNASVDQKRIRKIGGESYLLPFGWKKQSSGSGGFTVTVVRQPGRPADLDEKLVYLRKKFKRS